MSKARVVTYAGRTATVTWDQDLCIHAAECGRANGELFRTGRDPWCDPDEASDDEVRDVIARCPSGALAARFHDAPDEHAGDVVANTITVAYNGPLFASGNLAIQDAPERAPALSERAALCRCGKSSNKPYCDNSHLEADWQDYGAVGVAGDESVEPGGTLNIEIAKDGPLRISGNLTLIAGSGREAWRGTRTALCRCGLSANRPFCDGSHRKAGWSDDA